MVLFYHAYQKPLAKYNPLLKFLVVKMTLFFTFWQKIFLALFSEELLTVFDNNAKGFNGEDIIHRIEVYHFYLELLSSS